MAQTSIVRHDIIAVDFTGLLAVGLSNHSDKYSNQTEIKNVSKHF